MSVSTITNLACSLTWTVTSIDRIQVLSPGLVIIRILMSYKSLIAKVNRQSWLAQPCPISKLARGRFKKGLQTDVKRRLQA